MARRSTRVHTSSKSQRRQTFWIPAAPQRTTLAAADTAGLTGQLNAAALAFRPFTVVRTRGYFSIRSDQESTAENYGGAVGLAVVSDQAAAIGVTAIPTPIADQGSDLFFAYEYLDGRMGFITGVGFEGNVSTRLIVDSKAMRKVDNDQTIVLTAETDGGSSGVVITDMYRFLIMRG